MYKITRINNGILDTFKSMPLKDQTSDNDNSFSMNRTNFSKTTPNTNFTHPNKKWYGQNNSRDSSSVVERRKKNAIGVSLNLNSDPHSFTNIGDNTQMQSLQRVRNRTKF